MTHDPGPAFRTLHRPGAPFILANAWDVGSARVLAGLGAEAIGTTSSGHAFTLGRPDGGQVTRDEALAHAEALVGATPLPVSADLENGFADDPEGVAETIRLAAEVGLAGASIEDSTFSTLGSYPPDLALERVRAAVAAARALPRDFVLVARADGLLTGAYEAAEAVQRLVSFAEAGADCVFAPAIGNLEAVADLCQRVSVPVNALTIGPLARVTKVDLAGAGVARISLGGVLARVAHRALVDAGRAILEEGRFDAVPGIGSATVDALLRKGAS